MPPDEELLEELAAASLDADPELLPFLPSLLQDLEDLAVRATEALAVVRLAELRPGQRALDLGCGKGAVARALSAELGLAVHGIDAIQAFVDHASTQARREALEERCTFEVGDVREALDSQRDLDLVLLLGLGDLLGELDERVALLRRCVVPGGYLLVDDAYIVDPSAAELEELQHCYDRPTTLAMLQSSGDRIVAECTIDGPERIPWYRDCTTRIAARAQELAAKHPQAAELILDFADRQTSDAELLDSPLVGALWLLQRAEGDEA